MDEVEARVAYKLELIADRLAVRRRTEGDPRTPMQRVKDARAGRQYLNETTPRPPTPAAMKPAKTLADVLNEPGRLA